MVALWPEADASSCDLPFKSRFVLLECFVGWGPIRGFRNQVGALPAA